MIRRDEARSRALRAPKRETSGWWRVRRGSFFAPEFAGNSFDCHFNYAPSHL